LIKKYFFLFFFSFFINYNLAIASNIATINLEYILKNNIQYNSFLNLLDDKKNILQNEISNYNQKIDELKKSIDDESIFLNEEEINNRINYYNSEYEKFQLLIQSHEIFLSKNIDLNKQLVLDQIIKITQKISIDEKFDIIFSESNYFMSNNLIDISENIIKQLNNFDLKLKLYSKEEIF